MINKKIKLNLMVEPQDNSKTNNKPNANVVGVAPQGDPRINKKTNANTVGAGLVPAREKGITIVALIITIIILLILAGSTITSVNISNNVEPYNRMSADITLLEEKILIYYNKYREIPKLEGGIQNEFNDKTYYEIDLSKLQNITLNYGTKSNGSEDIYLVNNNLEVYYLKGIEKSGSTYHTK